MITLNCLINLHTFSGWGWGWFVWFPYRLRSAGPHGPLSIPSSRAYLAIIIRINNNNDRYYYFILYMYYY